MLSRAHIMALATGDGWIDRGGTILLFGPSGSGKSHLSAAFGHALIENGYRVLFTRTTDLVQRLQQARQALSLESAIDKLDKYHQSKLSSVLPGGRRASIRCRWMRRWSRSSSSSSVSVARACAAASIIIGRSAVPGRRSPSVVASRRAWSVMVCGRCAYPNARRRGHPFNLGFALTAGVHEFDHRFRHEDLRNRAEECERLGRENSLPVLWAQRAPITNGLALIREGKIAEGIAPLKAGITAWEASGGVPRSPTMKAFLAEGMALTGDLDEALQLIDEQIAQIERPGWEERLCYAEILRLKGWMLSLKGDLEGSERNFLTSLEWARRQQAKSWELRTSISLARLWQSQGKRQDAYELLAPVHGWFTEGFDTRDLLEAKALLAELG
jgi:energy-coupling factor transporter ATP-binding protein EcfA2